MLLQQQEGFENGSRRLVEHRFVNHVEQLVRILEARVDFLRRLFGRRENGGAHILQQDGVELGHRLGGLEILLHQLFAGAPRRRRGVAEPLGERGLVVEQQTVFTSAGQQVQLDSQALQEALAPFQALGFRVRNEAVAFQVLPAVAVARCLRDPEDALQVAQTAWALLAVRLEAVGRVLKTPIALVLFHAFGLEESLRIEDFPEARRKLREQRLAADQQAGLDQRRLYRQIAGSFFDAVIDGAHAMADFQADIPEQADHLFELCGERHIGRLGQQQQQVDVGRRPQQAASITADSNQCQAVWKL